VLLREYPALRCQFVYPIWKDPTIEARPWLKEKGVAKRVTVTKASAFDWKERVEVTGIFIAKSESWSPPWNDQKFTRFVEEAERHTGLPYAPYGSRDAVLERSWDAAGAEQIGRFLVGTSTSPRDVLAGLGSGLVAMGQMPKQEMEDAMQDFDRRVTAKEEP
jgi:transposase